MKDYRPGDKAVDCARIVAEITSHITEGIGGIQIRQAYPTPGARSGSRPARHLAEALDTLAKHSMPALKRKIAEMQRDLEYGRIEGFPGTMVLRGKPTFATFEVFYRVVHEQANSSDSVASGQID